MKNLHIISHSHWDREWYMPFEYHRSYLIKLIDNCMELFEKDENFISFHLDGHTALVEDYLEIKPENEEKIKEYIRNGKFAVGPWYVLQDEFLTSAEANIRNLLVGTSLAKKFGKVTEYGYFPDAFGNAGQMPQIMKQAGMKGIIFGRGVSYSPTNDASEKEYSDERTYSSKYSEIYWASPDGSVLPAAVYMNWYNNANEIPVNADKGFWERTIKNAERLASSDEILLMNGCDHQPVQKNLSEALENARKAFPEYNFIHSDFDTYMTACTKKLPEDVKTITGELISQDTDGWYTLVNTSSALVDLKIMNSKCEMYLESVAEPLSAAASLLGKKYPHEQLLYSWKTLMKNHPHDSICSCSCDAVNEEVRTRFNKSRQCAEMVVRSDLEFINKHIDTSFFHDHDACFAVYNTSLYEKTSLISTDIDVRREPLSGAPKDIFAKVNASVYQGEYELIDENGTIIPCTVKNRRSEFGYTLPDDMFRQPYVAERVTVEFEADSIPAMGYRVFGLRRIDNEKISLSSSQDKTLENKYMKVVINDDGTLSITDKKSGKSFSGLMRFEDTGDIGTEYTYVPATGEAILSGTEKAVIECVKNEQFVTEYKVTVEMEIPEEMGEDAKYEKSIMTSITERKGKRSDRTVTLPIVSYITLGKNSKRLDIKTTIDNNAKDHRIRVLFPTHTNAVTHKAETIFEAPERPNTHNKCRTYPSGCEHQQGYVMMTDGKCGLAVANIGLYEYETVGDTIAVTLLRAVSEMGDWGVFPTELSQIQRSVTLEYSIIPYTDESEAMAQISSFRIPMISSQLEKGQIGYSERSIISWSGQELKPTAFKNKMDSDDLILRWANYSSSEQTLTINKNKAINNLYMSNVMEENLGSLTEANGKWSIEVKPFEIITLGVKSI